MHDQASRRASSKLDWLFDTFGTFWYSQNILRPQNASCQFWSSKLNVIFFYFLFFYRIRHISFSYERISKSKQQRRRRSWRGFIIPVTVRKFCPRNFSILIFPTLAFISINTFHKILSESTKINKVRRFFIIEN